VTVRVSLAREAMATRFELVLFGDDPARLRAAGEEAFSEIEGAEARLSRFRPTSDLAWINSRAGRLPVRVDPRVFRLLSLCQELARVTEGAFDPTVGPLLRAWGFLGGNGRPPDPRDMRWARRLVGMERVELDVDAGTVRLPEKGMELDLGAIGKGYALDAAMDVLAETGVEAAFLHGGTSSVHTRGAPPHAPRWKVGWRVPGEEEPRALELTRPALAISAPHGKAFVRDGRTFGHVLDPRTGEPTQGTRSAAVAGPSSTVCDALSTALLVRGEPWCRGLATAFPGFEGTTA